MPPKPNELLSAASGPRGGSSAARVPTRQGSRGGSGFSKLRFGGALRAGRSTKWGTQLSTGGVGNSGLHNRL